jgi:hypothetical protein
MSPFRPAGVLFVVIAAAIWPNRAALSADPPARPNIVFILADDK